MKWESNYKNRGEENSENPRSHFIYGIEMIGPTERLYDLMKTHDVCSPIGWTNFNADATYSTRFA